MLTETRTAAARAVGADVASDTPGDLKHELLDGDTALPWLGDVIPIPGAGLIVSVGDFLLAAGIALLAYRASTSELRRARLG